MADGQFGGTRPDPTQAMLANLRYMRENNFSKEDIEKEIQKWQPKIAAYSAREREEIGTPGQAVKESLRGGVANLARGLPGGELALSTGRMIGSRIKGRPETFAEAREATQAAGQEYAQENPRAATALNILGGFGIARPIGAIGTALKAAVPSVAARGAIVGGGTAAAYRALEATPEEGATPVERAISRAKGTATAATIGTGVGAVAPWMMSSPGAVATTLRTAAGAGGGYLVGGTPGAVAGGAAMARPEATARMLATGAEKATGRLPQSVRDFMQSIGDVGELNREMQKVQRVMEPLGGKVGAPSNVAAENIARIQRFRQQADQLYNRARQDTRIVDNPEIRALMQDPDIAEAFEMAKAIRRANGGRVPTRVEMQTFFGPEEATMQPMGTAQSPNPSLRDAIDAFRTRFGQAAVRREGTVAQQMAKEQLSRRAGEAQGFPITGERTQLPITQPMGEARVVMELPDPELLHLTKRILADVESRAFGRDVTTSLAEGLRVSPKVDKLRAVLTKESKDFAAADRFTRKMKVAEEAFDIGFTSAAPGGAKPSAKGLVERTIAAARAFADEQKDDELRQIAEAAAMRGARAQMLQQVAGVPLERGAAGVLNVPALASSGEAAQQRQFALGGQAKSFQDLISGLRGEAAKETSRAASPGFRQFLAEKIAGRQMMQQVPAPQFTATERQNRIIGQILDDPEKYQQTLQMAARGELTRETLNNILSGMAGGQAGRRRGSTRSGYDLPYRAP